MSSLRLPRARLPVPGVASRELPRGKTAFVSARGASKFLLRRMHVCRFMRSSSRAQTKGATEESALPEAFPRSIYLTRVKVGQVFNDADGEEVTHIDGH